MLLSEVGTLTSPSSATTQAIALSNFGGETPKLIVMWSAVGVSDAYASDALLAMGAAASTSARASVAMNQEDGGTSFDEDRYHDDTVVIAVMNAAGTVIEQADLSSFSADTVTLSWEVVDGSATRHYHYLVLGGTAFEATVLQVLSPTSTGVQNVAHGLSGAPTALLAFSTHGLQAPPSKDGAAETGFSIGGSDLTTSRYSGIYVSNSSELSSKTQTSNFLSHCQPITVNETATVTADATNVILDWTAANTAEYYYIVAMLGVEAECGTYTTPTTTGSKVVTTSITPSVFMTWGTMAVSSASVTDDASIVFGASDGTTDACAGVLNTTASGRRLSFSNAVLKVGDPLGAFFESATLATISGSDVELSFSSAESTTYEMNYLALGDAGAGAISVGVEVVAWRTPGEEVVSSDPPVLYFASS